MGQTRQQSQPFNFSALAILSGRAFIFPQSVTQMKQLEKMEQSTKKATQDYRFIFSKSRFDTAQHLPLPSSSRTAGGHETFARLMMLLVARWCVHSSVAAAALVVVEVIQLFQLSFRVAVTWRRQHCNRFKKHFARFTQMKWDLNWRELRKGDNLQSYFVTTFVK